MIDNGDGTFTARVGARTVGDGVEFDVDNLPEGWEEVPADTTLIWTKVLTPDCEEPPVLVLPEEPTLETCVGDEPVTVIQPLGPEGITYQDTVLDNGDGTYTAVVYGRVADGYELDVDNLPDGWEQTGDETMEWREVISADCDDPLDVVEPDAPTVQTCVDGEPVVVTTPDGPDGVEYQSRVVDNDDGSFTVEVLAMASAGDGILKWTTTVTPECDDDVDVPELVTPESPQVETCVDGEPVVVTTPDGPDGVEYQSRVVDHANGSYTVEVVARAASGNGVELDLDALPEGWEHVGDGYVMWAETLVPDCDQPEDVPGPEDPTPQPPADDPQTPTLPPSGVTINGLTVGAVGALLLGAALLAVRGSTRRRFE